MDSELEREPGTPTGTTGDEPRPADDEADTEGHTMLPNPMLGRELSRAREREIQDHLRRREHLTEEHRRHPGRDR